MGTVITGADIVTDQIHVAKGIRQIGIDDRKILQPNQAALPYQVAQWRDIAHARWRAKQVGVFQHHFPDAGLLRGLARQYHGKQRKVPGINIRGYGRVLHQFRGIQREDATHSR